MCRSMVDIQSVATEIRQGKKKKIEEERRKKLQGKNIMAPLLHRAAIIIGPIANLKGHYFQPSLSVCVSLTGTSTLQR